MPKGVSRITLCIHICA